MDAARLPPQGLRGEPLLTGINPELEVAVRIATAVADVKVQLALTICPPNKPPRDCGNRLADEGDPQEDRALHQRAAARHGGDGARRYRVTLTLVIGWLHYTPQCGSQTNPY